MFVKYQCQCLDYRPVAELFFCPDCQVISFCVFSGEKPKCSFCVLEEIDSVDGILCPNCNDKVTSAYASENKNCCKNCFQCPRCSSALQYSYMDAEDKFKGYFFFCPYCRWESTEIALKGESPQILAEETRKRLEDPCQKTVDKISEKLFKEERDRIKEKKQGFKTRSTALYKNLELKGLDSPTKPNLREVVQPPKKLSQLEQEYEDKVNQLSQKLKKNSPTIVEDDSPKAPTPKGFHYTVKRAKRCVSCEKLLIKPSQQRKYVAMLYLPRLSIVSSNNAALKIRFTNPTLHLMNMTFKSKSIPIGADDNMEAVAVWSQDTKTYLFGKDFDDDEEKKYASEYKDDKTITPNFVTREQNSVIFTIPLQEQTSKVTLFVTASAGDFQVSFQAAIFEVNK